MTQLQKIENEVASLTVNDLAKFRSWFEEYDAEAWDKQIEEDVFSGKLDDLANAAIAEFKSGNFKEL